MCGKPVFVAFGISAGMLLVGLPSAAAVRYVQYRCQSVYPDTVFVEPGDTIKWTTNGLCDLPVCYYCYGVVVPGSPGGPFGAGGFFGQGYYDHCDPVRGPNSTAPSSPPVQAGAIPGYYSYVVEVGTQCFTLGAISGTILVAGLPTSTARTRWGRLKAIYR